MCPALLIWKDKGRPREIGGARCGCGGLKLFWNCQATFLIERRLMVGAARRISSAKARSPLAVKTADLEGTKR
jgi:hypothetical protein